MSGPGVGRWFAGGLVGLLHGLAGSGEPAPPAAIASSADDTVQAPLAAAARWLWSQQREHGGWSSQYAVLRSGQALTPFVLWQLLQVPASVYRPPQEAVARAYRFLREGSREADALGYADPELLDYPVYATGYAIRCFLVSAEPADHALAQRLARWLQSMQYQEANGFGPEHPAHGGFGFGAQGLGPGDPGHMELSHTRRSLQALAMAGLVGDSQRQRALCFLDLVQKQPSQAARQPVLPGTTRRTGRVPFDGGFYFSPVVLDANKGRRVAADENHDAHFGSYATATCDGALALLALGCEVEGPRLSAARRWLREHPRLDHPEGLDEQDPVPWGPALFFYHLAGRAEVGAALDPAGDWRGALVELLAARQEPDGHFVNRASGLQKEDDPLLATAHAITALVGCLPAGIRGPGRPGTAPRPTSPPRAPRPSSPS